MHTHAQVMEAVVHGEVLAQPEGCPNKLYMLMQRCWAQDPVKRPSFHDIAQQLRLWRREHMLANQADHSDASECGCSVGRVQACRCSAGGGSRTEELSHMPCTCGSSAGGDSCGWRGRGMGAQHVHTHLHRQTMAAAEDVA